MSKLKIIADTHVHFYPCYDFKLWASAAFKNFRALSAEKDFLKVIFLTERSDCNFFEQLQSGVFNNLGFEIEKVAANILNLKELASNDSLVIVAGRQIISKEKLEVLALGTSEKIEDQKPIRELISTLKNSSLKIVLPWSPGKWFFKRGEIIKELISEYQPNEITFADVISRPLAYPLPSLMKLAQKKGFSILAGSDPLPFAGEEKYVGTYAISAVVNSEKNEDLKTTLQQLLMTDSHFKIVGKRLDPLNVILRLYKNQKQKQKTN